MADISVIGGINIDIEGRPYEALRREDSNPGKISLSYGGVGRNITENVVRMGGNVAMISVIGGDHMGLGAKEHLKALGVDVSRIDVKTDATSAIYLSILNNKSDMEVAISDMDVVKFIVPEFLEKNADFILSSEAVALDGNLERETIEYIAGRFSQTTLFFDPVSAAKAVRAKDVIGAFTCIKPNIMEAEVLLGMRIENEYDLKVAGQRFIDKGVEKVFITLNKDGVYYKDRDEEGFIKPANVNIKSATGAGDSFSAAILMGMINRKSVREIAKYGMAAAQITMESSHAVSEYINNDEIGRRIKNV